jgi:hypothetical protein
MGLVVPNDVINSILDTFLASNVLLKLFSNDYSPAKDDVLADYTEVTGGGYAAITLVAADWSVTTADQCVASQTEKTFTFTGATTAPGTIYGYYVTNAAGTVLLWAERFSSSVLPFEPANGSEIAITPRITGESLF